jgi:hypothetical protein
MDVMIHHIGIDDEDEVMTHPLLQAALPFQKRDLECPHDGG